MIPRVVQHGKQRSFRDTAADVLLADASTNPARWWRCRGANAGRGISDAWATNCTVADPGLAVVEIAWTHSRQRATCRRTASYHLVVSFDEREAPHVDLLERIEQHLLDAIGLGHHPRIAAMHVDMERRHLHVLVSRVDPISDCVFVPKFDHRRLMQAARVIEDQHRLVPNYHGELRGRGPIPSGGRVEGRDPFLGDVDPLLATQMYARFVCAGSMNRAKVRDDLSRLTLELNQQKKALLAEEAKAIATIGGVAHIDRSAAMEARRAIRASTSNRRHKLVALGQERRKQIKASTPKLEWLPWLQSEADRGDQQAAELLQQLQHRAAFRRSSAAVDATTKREPSNTKVPSLRRHWTAKTQKIEGPDHEAAIAPCSPRPASTQR
ncbi:relaxase/mobilization nuclease domain-containing protein [Falsiroseomonas sp.]|uniref:relaxase/mobilization nuclease domain-containing protein n=1 Tax=Falsiroseomonas sp. TaxID=2870721 RepID=UPI003F718815